MKKKFLLLSAIASATVTLAGAATVTQTFATSIVQTSSFSSVPNTFIENDFALFDTVGGALTLTSVLIEVQFTKTGGQLSIDNDSATGATVNLTHRVAANLSEDNVLDFTKSGGSLLGLSGASNLLRATSSVSGVFVAANDGDSAAGYNDGGLDNYTFSPGDTTVSDSGEMSNISQFIGTGSYDLDFEATQTVSSSVNSGMWLAFGPSTMNGFVRVTYEFTGAVVPEPSVVTLMGACGAFALLRRRR